MTNTTETPKCTCDDFCDDPCPVHAKENELQNEVLKLRSRIIELEKHAILKNEKTYTEDWKIGKTSRQGNPGDADDEWFYIYLKDSRRFYSEEEALLAIQETWKEPLLALQTKIHAIARDHGWYDPPPSTEAAVLNIHGEVSELSEALRNYNPPSDKIRFFSAEEEAADIIIRVLDTAAFHGWRVIEAMVAKIEYNKTRPYRHGGKAY